MNPFCYGKVVSGKDFCPRKEAEDKLESNIQRGQNTYIMGERRIGKTSLIENVCQKMKSDFVRVFIDLRMLDGLEDFEKRVLSAIMKAESEVTDFKKVLTMFTSYKPTVSIDQATGESSFSFRNIEKTNVENVEVLFDHIASLNERKRVIVVFDEFQDVLRLSNPQALLAKMRAKIQLQPKVAYVFSGSIKENVQRIFTNPTDAMYNIAEPIFLDVINKAEFSQFITDKLNLGKFVVAPDLLDKIYEITENITGDTQQLCSALWDVTKPQEEMNGDSLNRALAHINAMRSEDFERVLDNMTNLQIKVLKALALNKKSKVQSQDFMEKVGHRNFTAVAKSVSQLTKRNIIYIYKKEYKFYSPFLREWLKTKV
jgi:AAA+ ATPase superfamily predicted ATPase